MPKIVIREQDLTEAGFYEAAENIILMVGKKALISKDKISGLLSNESEFIAAFKKDNIDCIGYKMALNLIKQGAKIIYASASTSEELEALAPALKDKSLYDIRFLCAGHLAGDKSANNTLINIAETRLDCAAVVDHPQDLKSAENVLEYAEQLEIGTGMGRYSQMYSPWCAFSDGKNAQGLPVEIMLPASYCYLMTFTSMLKNNNSWLAAAGVTRGEVPGLIKPAVEYGSNDIELMQKNPAFGGSESVGKSVNPICYVRPYGYRIWGNRTLNTVNEGLTASDFANVRQTVIDVMKQLYHAARLLTFEQNSDVLWINFKNNLIPLLEKMQKGNGIAGYKIIKNVSNQKATLNATIRIIPIEAVEYFDLTVELADTLTISE